MKGAGDGVEQYGHAAGECVCAEIWYYVCRYVCTRGSAARPGITGLIG